MSPTCPNREQLFGFVLGNLDEGAFETISDHVEHCPACEETVQTLEGQPGEILEELRQDPEPDPYEGESACRRAVILAEAAGRGEPLTPGTTPEAIRDYRLVEKLGEGGMGTVYQAVHTRLDRAVALKILPAGRVRDEAAVARFRREMKAVGKLRHPHIVEALDAGEEGETHYLAMEYVAGLDLGRLVQRLGPLAVADACELIRQTALGLQHAHEHGLVHRDVKPSNLILARAETAAEPPMVKVLDLGLALLQPEVPGGKEPGGEALTGTGQVMGTLDYMAPEQIRQTHTVDARADVYGLGCTLYKLLTGRAPFAEPRHASAFDKMLAHAQEPAPALREQRSDAPDGLAGVLERLLAKDPAGRYASAAEVAEALMPFTAGCDLAGLLASGKQETRPGAGSSPSTQDDPVERQADTTESGRRPGRRNWRLLAVAAGLLLVVGPAGYFFGGTVVRFVTNKGVLVVEVDDPDVRVTVKQGGVVVSDKSTGREFTLTAKGGEIEVYEKDGIHLLTRKFTLKRGGKERVNITLEVAKVRARRKEEAGAGGDPVPVPENAHWQPGPAEDVFPGIVPRPAAIPGIKRWQAETISPRAFVTSADLSPDGRLLACPSDDAVRIYDIESGNLAGLLVGHAGVQSVTWSPDGKWIATGGSSADPTVRLWRPDGTPVHVLRGHRQSVLMISWDPQSKRLVSVSQDEGVRLWHAERGLAGPFNEILPTGWKQSVAWSPDGKTIAAGTHLGKVHILDARDLKLRQTLDSHTGAVSSLAWSGDGRWLVSGSSARPDIRLWQTADFQPGPTLKGGRPRFSLEFSPDSRWLLSGGEETMIWDVEKRKRELRLRGRLNEGTGGWTHWNQEGTCVVGCNPYGGIWVWHEVKDWVAWPIIRKRDPADFGTRWGALAWSPDRRRFAHMNRPGKAILLRDARKGEALATWEGAGPITWSGDGRWIGYTPPGKQGNGWYALWDVEKNTQGPIWKNLAGDVHPDQWSPDGRWVARPDGKAVRLLEVPGGKEGFTLETGVPTVESLTWSPDAKRLALLGTDKQFRVFDIEKNKELFATPVKETGRMHWSPVGDLLAIPLRRGVLVLDATNGEKRYEVGAGSNPAFAWSSDGKRITTGSMWGQLALWDAEKGQQLARLPHRMNSRIHALAWSPDGKYLTVEAGTNSKIVHWDMDTRQPAQVNVLLSGGKVATFSAAGNLLSTHIDLDKELVYVVEDEDGKRRLLESAEFRALVKKNPPAQAAPRP